MREDSSVRRPYRKGGARGMEEENVLRSQPTEFGVACLVNKCPLLTCLEAAHHEADRL